VNGDAADFDQLAGAALVLDRAYRGGALGGTGDGPQFAGFIVIGCLPWG
jgi:hypothetical protein